MNANVTSWSIPSKLSPSLTAHNYDDQSVSIHNDEDDYFIIVYDAHE